jgi:hypothetical protein
VVVRCGNKGSLRGVAGPMLNRSTYAGSMPAVSCCPSIYWAASRENLFLLGKVPPSLIGFVTIKKEYYQMLLVCSNKKGITINM